VTIPFAAGALMKGGSLLGGIAKRLKQPSEKRAAAVAPQAVASANQGNLTAAKMICDRTTFGIAKERAVWSAACAQINPAITAAAQAARIPAGYIDQSTPESAVQSALAHPIMMGANGAAAPVAPSYPPPSPAVPAGIIPPAPGARPVLQPQPVHAPVLRTHVRYNPQTGQRINAPLGSFEDLNWSNRKPSMRQLAGGTTTSGRTHVRYNPQTGARVNVQVGTYEDTNWPSRKPSQKARREIQQATTAVGRAIPGAVGGIVESVGVGGASTAALAGLAAYIATRAVQEGAAESDTIENSVARYRSMAATEFNRRNGRMPSQAEYAELRAQVGHQIDQALRAMSPNPLVSLPARWQAFISQF
jgi:hypothetical protein